MGEQGVTNLGINAFTYKRALDCLQCFIISFAAHSNLRDTCHSAIAGRKSVSPPWEIVRSETEREDALNIDSHTRALQKEKVKKEKAASRRGALNHRGIEDYGALRACIARGIRQSLSSQRLARS